MTGWRAGWLSHPASVAPQLAQMTQLINSGTSGPIQEGALAALTQGETLVETMRERCRSGIALAYDALQDNPAFRLPERPRGGMYVFFSLPATPDSRHACLRILEAARVGLAPGSMFGQSSAEFVRMCVCRDPAQLGQALERMAGAIG
jgi:aspartate aminotransferase